MTSKNIQTAIVVFTFNRPTHTKKTLDALRSSSGATDLPLFVFSDGPRSDEDIENCKKVVSAVKEIEWPSKIVHTICPSNKGLAKSITDGVSSVLSGYDQVIVLEDDIVLSGSAIQYFSSALSRYRNLPTVGSICGYADSASRLKIPASYPYDAYFLPRFYSWGWATWRDRWNSVDWNIDAWTSVGKDKYSLAMLLKTIPDLPHMLDDQVSGLVDSWAVRFAFHHFMSGKLSLVPVRSHVNNIGMDGTGTHSRATNRFRNNVAAVATNPVFPPMISIDRRIQRRYIRLYRRQRLRSSIKKLAKEISE